MCCIEAPNKSNRVTVKIISDINEITSEKNHMALTSSQRADPLFNGPAWQKAWWRSWGEGLQLHFTVINDRQNIVGIMPLYIDRFKYKRLIELSRIQFIGTNYQNITTPRAEYLSFSFVNGFEQSLMDGLAAIESAKWDEFVARDILKGGYTAAAITKWADDNNWLIRVIHSDTAYSINTAGDFKEYKAKLGPNTRLKLINRRNVLYELGGGAITNYYPDRVDEFFKLLSFFHQNRWGDCFSEKTVSFHKEVINTCAPGGLEVELSVLSVNGCAESVIFNYVLDGRVYNISSGFNQSFHKKISIGTLHFGYLIEAAFESPTISVFDFLAGNGKNSNYKANLSTDSLDIYSLKIIRTRLFKVLYLFKDCIAAIQAKVDFLLNRLFR